MEVLRQRRPGGDFTENLLERALAQTGLSSLDRALCQELVYGVVRWQATLDWLVGRKTDSRKQNLLLQNLLRLGLYQIFWLDRIPGHAAVHETVELTKRNGLGAQAGFVNAILRRYLREFEMTKKLLADLKRTNPALGGSHPGWLVARWQKRWGVEKTTQLLEWNNTPPKTYARVNTLKWAGSARRADRTLGLGVPALLEKWRAEGLEYNFFRCGWLEENLVFELKSHPPLASLASFQQGWFYLQDPSTLLAVCKLEPQPNETILDFCAAPGGKTTFIAQLMNNEGRVVAQDVSEERLKLVQENCQRLGVACVETSRSRGNEALTSITGKDQSLLTSAPAKQQFDRVLVDAPCSNTGVMCRRVDLRWRIRPKEILRLQRTQLALLEQAAPKLKPGGVLVYSTCSLEPEENQEIVTRFLHEHKKFKLKSAHELLPFADKVDGAFVARLKRLP